MDYQHICALVILGFCAGITWSCICRLNKIKKHHPRRILIRYAFLLMGAVVYGLAPILFREWPGIAGVVFSGAVLLMLLLNAIEWGSEKNQVPTDLAKEPG